MPKSLPYYQKIALQDLERKGGSAWFDGSMSPSILALERKGMVKIGEKRNGFTYVELKTTRSGFGVPEW